MFGGDRCTELTFFNSQVAQLGELRTVSLSAVQYLTHRGAIFGVEAGAVGHVCRDQPSFTCKDQDSIERAVSDDVGLSAKNGPLPVVDQATRVPESCPSDAL
jgi:hypothetical protein